MLLCVHILVTMGWGYLVRESASERREREAEERESRKKYAEARIAEQAGSLSRAQGFLWFAELDSNTWADVSTVGWNGTESCKVVWIQPSASLMFLSKGVDFHFTLMQAFHAYFQNAAGPMLPSGRLPESVREFNNIFYSYAQHTIVLAGVTRYGKDVWTVDLNTTDFKPQETGSTHHDDVHFETLSAMLKAIADATVKLRNGSKLRFHPTSRT